MKSLHLLLRQFPLKSPSAPVALHRIIKEYGASRSADDADKVSEIGKKARSTAEEFSRVAKEKTESVRQGTKKTLESAEEAMVGEDEADKKKFKENVEKGYNGKIGKD